MAAAADVALREEQLLQTFVARHQHRVGLEHQLRPPGCHAQLLQLLRAQLVQEIRLALALDPLLPASLVDDLSGELGFTIPYPSFLGLRN